MVACIDCTDIVWIIKTLLCEKPVSCSGYSPILRSSPPPTNSLREGVEYYEWYIPASECSVSVGDNSEDWDVVDGDV